MIIPATVIIIAPLVIAFAALGFGLVAGIEIGRTREARDRAREQEVQQQREGGQDVS